MSARVAFIGDSLLASGLALSGVQVYTPPAEAAAIWEDFKQARANVDLVLISVDYAELLGEQLVRFETRTPIPPVLRLPAANQSTAPVRKTIQAARTSLGLS